MLESISVYCDCVRICFWFVIQLAVRMCNVLNDIELTIIQCSFTHFQCVHFVMNRLNSVWKIDKQMFNRIVQMTNATLQLLSTYSSYQLQATKYKTKGKNKGKCCDRNIANTTLHTVNGWIKYFDWALIGNIFYTCALCVTRNIRLRIRFFFLFFNSLLFNLIRIDSSFYMQYKHKLSWLWFK